MKFQYHLITDHARYRQPLHEAAREAEMNHVSYFQLREKKMAKRDLLELAKHIRPSLENTKFIVNGHLDVAFASNADGIHLQSGNIPAQAVRQKFPELIIGYSVHSYEELKEAELAKVDYVFISPVFVPISKETKLPPLGIKKFREFVMHTRIPVFALGGITATNLPQVVETGCYGVAGISLFLHQGQFTASGMTI